MKIYKHLILSGIILLASALLFAACGPQTTPAPTPPETGTTTAGALPSSSASEFCPPVMAR